MKKPTLILVADGAHSKFFTTTDRGASITALPDAMTKAPPNPRNSELMSDAQPRAHKSAGIGGHAIASKSDPHQKNEDRFAASVARQLEAMVEGTAYKGVVVFAPPIFLGTLRKELSKHASEKITAEQHKDLTKAPTESVREHVRQLLFPD